MIRNVYIVVVVGLRLAGLWFIVGSALAMFLINLVGGGFRGQGAGFALIPTLVPLVGGIALWICAKPIASAVTANLE